MPVFFKIFIKEAFFFLNLEFEVHVNAVNSLMWREKEKEITDWAPAMCLALCEVLLYTLFQFILIVTLWGKLYILIVLMRKLRVMNIRWLSQEGPQLVVVKSELLIHICWTPKPIFFPVLHTREAGNADFLKSEKLKQ